MHASAMGPVDLCLGIGPVRFVESLAFWKVWRTDHDFRVYAAIGYTGSVLSFFPFLMLVSISTYVSGSLLSVLLLFYFFLCLSSTLRGRIWVYVIQHLVRVWSIFDLLHCGIGFW
ncbi:hypothetical protein QBC32DRAFT_113954 [Pseudoneurospora amorphoporcata]|uniref:Uncharacterized protein n=1 Tax=Pseudoneurospora amorphoporcata TaxID=241081 RepID=A0AAN6NX11_9PEZI|nr:hypothetical protein QBC32DRAFT_113954 [Pseudoneurospora amorphoporcata]